MSHTIVEFYTPEGEVKVYRPLSVRLPEFLAQYGPDKGYALVTEVQDSLSFKSGLLRLYEQAIQAGHKPQELGLPSPALAGQMMTCRATLSDSEGRVVASAHAEKLVQTYKNLEALETAARQRLLAALGFGGEVLDEDEAHQNDQGLTATSTSPAPDAEALAAAPVSEHEPADSSAHLEMLHRQIKHLASTRGIEAPSVSSVEEARAVLKRLVQGNAA